MKVKGTLAHDLQKVVQILEILSFVLETTYTAGPQKNLEETSF